MNFACGLLRFRVLGIACAGLVLVLAGCATKIDWQARVGHYTYDQALVELGPPDKSAKLSDGAIVANWLTQPSQTVYMAGGGTYYPNRGAWVGMAGGPVTAVTTPNYYLRLMFDPAGKLQWWKKVAQ